MLRCHCLELFLAIFVQMLSVATHDARGDFIWRADSAAPDGVAKRRDNDDTPLTPAAGMTTGVAKGVSAGKADWGRAFLTAGIADV